MLYAHRIAWELTNGLIPEGKQVLHCCDVRRYVRPEHLFVGSDLENRADMAVKGRGTRSKRGLPRGVSRHGRGWSAEVKHRRRTRYLGTFDTIKEAASVAEREHERLYVQGGNVEVRA